MTYSTSRGSAFDGDHVFGIDDAGQPRTAEHGEQLGQLGPRVEVGLVEHEQDRLVAGGQLDQRRVLDFVQVGIGDEQHQVGPLGRLAGHFAARGAVDFVEAGRVDQHDLRVGQPGHAVAGAAPGDVPDVLGPAAADVHLRRPPRPPAR